MPMNHHIDWDSVWKNLNWDDENRRQEADRQRLHQRAIQYARPIDSDANSETDSLTVLAFKLGNETYALDVMLVRSVRSAGKITRVPSAPHFYRGVVNARGQIISALDLRLFFDIPVLDSEPPAEMIVTHTDKLELGLLVHAVAGVMTIPRREIEAAEGMRYALGVTAGHLILLDVANLFEDDRLRVGESGA